MTATTASAISRKIGPALTAHNMRKGADNGWTTRQDGSAVDITLNYPSSDRDEAALDVIREALGDAYTIEYIPVLAEYDHLPKALHGCAIASVRKTRPAATQEAPAMPETTEAADITVAPGTTVTFTLRGEQLTGAVESAGPLRAATIARRTAPAAPQGLADWERDLLATADSLPTAEGEPSADQNIAEGDDPQGPLDADHAPASVWVTTEAGERIEYAYIPNGDPQRVGHFLAAARAVPTFRDVSTQQATS